MGDLSALLKRIKELEDRLSDVENNTVLTLDGSLKRVGKNLARFEGVNVQIVNGTGRTNSVNGRGNLIVGYNETRTGGGNVCSDGQFDTQSKCTANTATWAKKP